MFIFNVLLTHEFCSPKSQFVKYQCLFSMYYHYVNSTVLSHNSQNVNVCVLSMYYNVLLMYFSRKREGSLTAKSHCFQMPDHQQRLSEIPANQAKFTSFAHRFHEWCKIRTIYLSIILYVSDACPGRELSEIPANQAKFTPFAHKSGELHEIHTKIHPQSSSLFSEPSTENH